MLILLSPPETELEEKTRWLGALDSTLSNHGKDATIDLATDMRLHPSRIYCARTAHIIEYVSILLPGAESIVVEQFTDRSMGSLTGRTYRETMVEFPRRNWLEWKRSYWSVPPCGESLFDISDRVLTYFGTKVLPIPAAENVMVVCAPDIMRILIGFLRSIEETEIPTISVEPNIPYVLNGDLVNPI